MIKSIVKAIKILQLLSDADGNPMTLAEIEEASGYNKSTCAHILETLVSENMAERVSRKDGYAIGYGAFMLSRFGGFNHRMKAVTNPVLRWLTAKTGQTSLFCVLKGDKRVCIDLVPGEYRLSEENIRVENLPKASTGIVLIANMPPQMQREFFEKYHETADETENSLEILEQSIAEVRRLGYGENHFALEDGRDLRGFAFPVFKNGECVGAVGMPYIGERTPSHLKPIKQAAAEISRRLEFFDEA